MTVRSSAASQPRFSRWTADISAIGPTIVFVAAVVGAFYWPVLSVQSLVSDDFEYMTQNHLVQSPSFESAVRFLRELEPSTVQGHYQPLTMISLMLDCAAGGGPANLRPFRITNYVLHLANAALIVLLTYLLFGKPGPAAIVGLVFGLHPTTVETVAWLSDRKTVLAAFFALASLVAYVRFAQSRSRTLLAFAFALYVLGVLSKAAVMPLPAVFLLLDFWPLRRLSWRALIEKTPFFLIAAASAAITLFSHDSVSPARMPWEPALMPLPLLICRNLLFYPLQFVCPVFIAPHHDFPAPPFLRDALTVAGICAAALIPALLLVSLRWTRALLTGWLVYVVIIFPVLGIVGFMDVVSADRHLYFSMIGFLLILAWLIGSVWLPASGAGLRHVQNGVIAAVCAAPILIEVVIMRQYLFIWQDTERLYRYMIAHAPRAPEPRYNLAIALGEKGAWTDAERAYKEAIRLRPAYWPAHSNLGALYRQAGQLDLAAYHYAEALRLNPENHVTHNNFANLLVQRGRAEEAMKHFHEALRIAPDYATARVGLANILAARGEMADAIEHYRIAVSNAPGDYRPRLNLAACLASQARWDEALEVYDAVIRLAPTHAPAYIRRGIVLENLNRWDEAIAAYREALKLQPGAAEAQARLDAAVRRTSEP